MWEKLESFVAPCQWLSPAGNWMTSPTLTTTSSFSVAQIPLPAVTMSTWSVVWVWNLLRAPGANVTWLILKNLLMAGVMMGCWVTCPPVKRALVATFLGTLLTFTIFMAYLLNFNDRL